MTLVSPKALKYNISMNNGLIALKFCTCLDAVSIEEYIYRVNMAHIVKSGQLRANMPKEGQLSLNTAKYR